ncbi:ABC-type Fe3+/spermidine/putrescine transport system ATPase subunit [Amaricoccus macauensis]|uniref:ABC-type Fe3+/spermidine/putrescine transport system ATPase subunit n=1 Tax=Amaricoccus macauensis TaxID=57001 RepID=A0A840SKI2_9RHOB|nr:hypothetical protein [Amaricoccus macauensis]MBB5220396.1 ABC-type Fe3+/spermidine/putrescine transport system ATPase subunit [Amaricoccus macauensis]
MSALPERGAVVIAQEGSPEDLYSRPRTLFAADFIGNNGRLEGKVIETRDGFTSLDCDGLRVAGRIGVAQRSPGDSATAGARLDRLGLGAPGSLTAPRCAASPRCSSASSGRTFTVSATTASRY